MNWSLKLVKLNSNNSQTFIGTYNVFLLEQSGATMFFIKTRAAQNPNLINNDMHEIKNGYYMKIDATLLKRQYVSPGECAHHCQQQWKASNNEKRATIVAMKFHEILPHFFSLLCIRTFNAFVQRFKNTVKLFFSLPYPRVSFISAFSIAAIAVKYK